MASLVYAAADAAALLEPARELIGAGDLRAGVTALPGLLVARWLGTDVARLRHAYTAFCAQFRRMSADLPARLPAVWMT